MLVSKLLAFAFLSLTVAANAQTTWNVGPGNYNQIRDVLPLAAPGDVVLVAPGTYAHFDCSVGLTIRATVPGTVAIEFVFGSQYFPPGCGCQCLLGLGATRFTQPPGQATHCVGLHFVGNNFFSPLLCGGLDLQHRVEVWSGVVTFDDCIIEGGTNGAIALNGALNVYNAAAYLQDCTVSCNRSGSGIDAIDSDMTIAGGSVTGGPSPNGILAAGNGITLNASRLHASHTTIVAGDPLGASIGARGIEAIGGSLWISDSTVTGMTDCAIMATGVVRIDRTTLTGNGVGCAVSPTGAPLVGIERSSSITIGGLFQVTLTSAPGALQLVYGSLRLGAPLSLPIVEQPIWIDPTRLFLAEVAVAGATGQTTFSWQIPATTQLLDEQFWLLGMGGTTFPLQSTPVVGGMVR